MTDLTPDHPAVEAAAQQLSVDESSGRRFPPSQRLYETAAGALTAALPHLTADDFRNTPPGWQLMAVGYKAALAQIDALADFYEEDGDTNMAKNMRDVRRRMARRRPYLEGAA